MKHAARFLALLVLTGTAHAWQPDEMEAVHTGVASCASSMCHGSVTDRPESAILRNEYLTWQRHDAHSGAYQSLLSDRSKRMAERLGIRPAHEAGVCLDCHTDHVPESRRGERFQLSDGVGCEACHGGAERWLSRHTAENASHADNVAHGLVPLERADVRARVCSACHVADDNRFAGHDLMGAGHPRLQFELMTYSILQPRHYQVDEDYLQRKPDTDEAIAVWMQGQFATARRLLTDLRSERFTDSSLWPELAYFDCHACHAPMGADKSDRPRDIMADAPGSVRLNDASLMMLWVLEQTLPGGDPDGLRRDLAGLHRASRQSHQAVGRAAATLEARLSTMEQRIARQPITRHLRDKLVEVITSRAAQGYFDGYLQAEQATMAAQAIMTDGEARVPAQHRQQLQRVFNTLRNPDGLDAPAFRRAMRALGESLQDVAP